MPLDPIKNYRLDQAGVIVDQDPILAPPGALTKAQNATNDLYGEHGSLRKRPGLANFNSTATASSVLGGIGVPILLGSAGPIIGNPFTNEAVTVANLTAGTTTQVGTLPIILGSGTTFDDASYEYTWDSAFDFSEIPFTSYLDIQGYNNTQQLEVSADNKTIQSTKATTTAALPYLNGEDAAPDWTLFLTTDNTQTTNNSTTYTGTAFQVFPSNAPTGSGDTPTNWQQAAETGHWPISVTTLGNILYYVDANSKKTVRAFDGFTDKPVLTIPTGIMVLSLFGANNTLFLTTIDVANSGVGGGTSTGSVYAFNPSTSVLTQLGAQFPAAHTPYSMTWAYSRLWVGTAVNDSNNTTAGKVYWIRPSVDTAFTLDNTFSTGEMYVASLATFQGKIYAGLLQGQSGTQTTRIAVRSTAGVWTTSTSSSDTLGGFRGYESLLVWPAENSSVTSPVPALYATHYDSTHDNSGGTIFKFDGSSWTTARAQDTQPVAILGSAFVTDPSTNTIVPLIVAMKHGGSVTLTVSKNGTTWTNIYTPGSPSPTSFFLFNGIIIQVAH